MNAVHITGRLTHDPELKATKDGKAVVNVGVALIDPGHEDTVFVDLVAWEKTAEFIGNYGAKGRRFEASCRLAYRTWDRADGTKATKHELVVNGPYAFSFSDRAAERDGDGAEVESEADENA
ncbi:MAG: single-stranded DNA-binding protein [Actinobacteria bacterium]|nr:single-stranded DNA-binding protein [Actinomycetota bacterium]